MRAAPSGDLLALDLGATKFAYGLSDGRRRPRVRSVEVPRLDDAGREFELIAETLTNDHSTYASTPVLCAAPSLSWAGVVESWPNRPYWQGFPLLSAAQVVLGTKPRMVGDGDAAAIADAGEERDAYYVSLFFGTGVAGGIVRNGSLVRLGPTSPELGHIPTQPDGPGCPCGLRGCFQTSWVAFREGVLARASFAASLAGLVSILARVFPRCTISLGGRFFAEDRVGAQAVLADVRRAVGSREWSPAIRLSQTGVNGPLTGALMLAGQLSDGNGRKEG